MRVTLHIGNILVEGSHQVIAGRCIHGPLKVGDRFTSIYTGQLNPDYSTQWIPQSGVIELRIERLETYGTVMETIDEGLTLEAWVSGHGFEILKLGQSVSNDSTLAKQ